MNNSRITLIVGLLLAVLVGLVIFGGANRHLISLSNVTQEPVESTIDERSPSVGTVASSSPGSNSYSNKAYGFSFEYPAAWYVEDGGIAGSVLTFSNYDPVTAPGKGGFPAGDNKIQVGLSASDIVSESSASDFPQKIRSVTHPMIAGVTATLVDIALAGDEQMLVYFVPLKGTQPHTFLSMVIYGDPANFYVLQNLTKSLKFDSNDTNY